MGARLLLSAFGVAALTLLLCLSSEASAWSNGGYSSEPSHPDYGTHDWIAQHALDWLPANEKQYITANLASYLYGTELPDNGGALDGIGDTTKHHIYYYSSGTLQDDASAIRASQEFQTLESYLSSSNYAMAAKTAGIMSRYIVDPAVFGHVMGASTDWGAEVHHSDYEDYVTAQMTSYSSGMFDSYLVFDGTLENISAYDATLQVGRITTFGDSAGTQTCTWMDTNCDWADATFKNSAGASLNRAVNTLADALHTLAVQAIQPGPTPETVNPTVAIVSPTDGSTLTSASVTITGTAADNVAVQKVEVSTDGTTWSLVTGTTSWSISLTLAIGSNTIRAKATDTSGNVAAISISVMVEPPTAPPSPQGLDMMTIALVSGVLILAVAGFALLLRKRSRG